MLKMLQKLKELVLNGIQSTMHVIHVETKLLEASIRIST